MDEIDQKILRALKENARSSASEIGRKVLLSVPAVSERMRKLEESGVIEQYTVKLNREKTGLKLLAFVFVDIDRAEHIESFRKEIVSYSEVLECHHIAGENDYLLKILVEDTGALESFLSEHLKKMKGVVRSNTVIALSTLKEEVNP